MTMKGRIVVRPGVGGRGLHQKEYSVGGIS